MIVATTGASDANSYLTIAQADAYFDGRLRSDAWTNASNPNREKALITACRQLSQLQFKGERLGQAQALPFPRACVYGEVDTSQTIPEEVQWAQAEQAIHLLELGCEEQRHDLQAQGVLSAQMGHSQEQYSSSHILFGAPALCPAARSLLQRWLRVCAKPSTMSTDGVVVNRPRYGSDR